jgi:hypothetical protein
VNAVGTGSYHREGNSENRNLKEGFEDQRENTDQSKTDYSF